jgi:hypothetical protein
VDIVPRHDRVNLDFLSSALRALDACVYVSAQETLRFEHDGASLADAAVWHLATAFGGLDITYVPAGTTGYSDLAERSQRIDIGGVVVRVAALEDIIRSKEAANREKDLVVLPALRRLLERSTEPRSSPREHHDPDVRRASSFANAPPPPPGPTRSRAPS